LRRTERNFNDYATFAPSTAAAIMTEPTRGGNRISRTFKIIDEMDHYLVVDKAPFVLMHPTKPNGAPTLWKELRELLAFEIANAGQVSMVNRLDRETSGLVLVAKTSAAARKFGILMQQRRVKKEYLAIVWGWPEWETKVVDAPLDRQGKHRESAIWLKQTIHPAGGPAQTEFHVERRFIKSGSCGDGKFSLIRAIPHTGRTHQIRVHLASIGCPIVGDKIYGPDEQLYLRFIQTGWTPELEHQLLLPRHALHSTKLAIEGEGEWTSPLPVDLTKFLEGRPPCRPSSDAAERVPP
jgi:23S rRNA pseudouridine1911/1915/1917 synthase